MGKVGVLTQPPDPEDWGRRSCLLHLKHSPWLQISPGATWCPVSQNELFKKHTPFQRTSAPAVFTFSQYTFLWKDLIMTNFQSLFCVTPVVLQLLNAPDSEDTSPAAGTWRQPAESNMMQWMGLIRSIMQGNNHSIQRIWMEIQKTFCKTVEEAELTGRAGINIFTYSWERLYGRQKKGKIVNKCKKSYWIAWFTSNKCICSVCIVCEFDVTQRHTIKFVQLY